MSFEGYNLNVNKVEALKFQITIEVAEKKSHHTPNTAARAGEMIFF
jgi:hypothetical protein